MKIGFVIPDGVGIRNYLYSKLLKKLFDENVSINIMHKLNEKVINDIKEMHNIEFDTSNLYKYNEPILARFLRELICISRLKYNRKITNNETLILNWTPNKRKLKNYIFFTLIETLSNFTQNYNTILRLEELQKNEVRKSNSYKNYLDLLEKLKMNTILNTHQRSIDCIPLFEAANDLNIRTISVIYSWDNLPKARLNSKSSDYLVWSDYMKKELLTYYPEVDESSIYITGTPQFEFYYDKSLYIPKDEFCKKFDLNKDRKIICFSGDDKRTSPFDPNYLEELAESISKLDYVNRPQILFRRCPVDLSDRYDNVIEKYKDIIKVSAPLWNKDSDSNNWSLVYPSFDDVNLLVNTALHCDLVYNVGSTMAHDFAIFNKPAAYINYDHTKEQIWKTSDIYKFQHFRSMKNKDSVYWVDSKKHIETLLNKLIDNSLKDDTKSKKIWLETISYDNENVSENIRNVILKGYN